MNVFYLLVPALVFYLLAQRFYARFLGRAFGEDDTRATPAVRLRDDVDYVPTRPHVLFAHHFSAIAAAGPIIGPTWALLYGYAPAFAWIVVGAILIGAVHDYACLFVSMREGGRSIAEIARKTIGPTAFVLFALFIVFNLVVVNAVFINMTAVSLTSLRAPADLGLPADQTIFRTVSGPQGQPLAVVGGIASTSAIALTVIAPVLGFLVVRRRMRELFAYPLATALCIGSVLVGFAWPVAMPALHLGPLHLDPAQVWVLIIALYVWFAAAVPVWLILQPREFVSVQFLYLGILLLLAAAVGTGVQGTPIQAPPAEIAQGERVLGAIWPSLFITIACGAVSGFHGLVASGTTSKQIARESHAKHVGYLGMLGESALALCVTLAIAVGMSYAEYTSFLVAPAGVAGWKANPVLAFSVGVAGICHSGLGIPPWLGVVFGLLMVEGFVLDTLDVAIRLNRYLLEEIWAALLPRVPRFLKNYWVNSGVAVGLMLALAWGGRAEYLWPLFGSGNQLLAALSLTTLAIWFYRQGRPVVYALVPAVLAGATTVASLVYLLTCRYWPAREYLRAGVAIIFLALAAGVGLCALRAVRALRRETRR
ncbi:MAG: carbon starvation protein A [Planctomycetes bacterium]|nr:carbon starvation protein A [Planctomycetota bacterium]